MTFTLLITSLVGPHPAPAENWPGWRGLHGDGRCTETNLPLHWSTTEGVRWRLPMIHQGNSTPIVWGERVFLTAASEETGERQLLCVERATGRLLWQAGTNFNGRELTHSTNPQASSSPVTDGERVIAWFGSAGLHCHDFDGRELWRADFGAQRHIWGYGSSPVLHGDMCFLNFGPGVPSFLVAVDKRTGRERWRVTEANANSGEEKPGVGAVKWIGSWSTPVIVDTGSRDELLLSLPMRLTAFDPTGGDVLWSCSGLNELVYTSPLYDLQTGIVVAMGGYSGKSLAVRAGGTGDVTGAHRLWHHPRTEQRIGSGVIHQGHIYIHNDPGTAECLELTTGKQVWKERLRGPAPKSESWSSMLLAGDRLYTINQGGDAFVLRASPHFEVLATNSLGETTMASLAASKGEFFVRTHQHLWCIHGATAK
jgi:outer membrane protein assembly factor BamB